MSNTTIKELPLIIYQNTYFTDSLISIIEEGLTEVEKEKLNKENKQDIGLDAKAESKSILGLLPLMGYLQGKGNFNFSDFRSLEQDKKITDSYRFTKIKEYIKKENVECTTINSDTTFGDLELGQFVEFTSNYKKNEIREIIDMILNEDVLDLLLSTPFLNINSKFFKEFADEIEITQDLIVDPKTKNFDKITNQKGKQKLTKSNPIKTEFTKKIYKIIERLKKDFPEEAVSLDFYGQIQNTEIKNFLICDTKFFVQEDKNRILDGKFKVFGKIIDIQNDVAIENENSIEKSFSQLDRNQFFKRATDESIQKIQNIIETIISSFGESGSGKLFDSKINLVTKGKAIKILPIVIYT